MTTVYNIIMHIHNLSHDDIHYEGTSFQMTSEQCDYFKNTLEKHKEESSGLFAKYPDVIIFDNAVAWDVTDNQLERKFEITSAEKALKHVELVCSSLKGIV